MDPWGLELIVTRDSAVTGGERKSLSRDVAKGLLHRVRHGVHVDRSAWEGMTGHDGARARHVVAMRALDAVASRRPEFSHWSAAVLHGLPLVGEHLDRVHVTVSDECGRGVVGVAAHVFGLRESEVVDVGGLLVTDVARTVVDVAGSSPMIGGIAVADAALLRGLPRALLEQAVDLVGPRRSISKAMDAVAFAHPGAEGVPESQMRWSLFRLGFAPQELQHEIWDLRGLAGVLDSYDRRRRIGLEADGDVKYLDPKLAPQGAGRALIDEKRREDRVRAELAGLARFTYAETSNPTRMRPKLLQVGLVPEPARPTIEDYAAVARAAAPRRRFVPTR